MAISDVRKIAKDTIKENVYEFLQMFLAFQIFINIITIVKNEVKDGPEPNIISWIMFAIISGFYIGESLGNYKRDIKSARAPLMLYYSYFSDLTGILFACLSGSNVFRYGFMSYLKSLAIVLPIFILLVIVLCIIINDSQYNSSKSYWKYCEVYTDSLFTKAIIIMIIPLCMVLSILLGWQTVFNTLVIGVPFGNIGLLLYDVMGLVSL